MNIAEFEELSNSDNFKTPPHQSYEEIEKLYWDGLSEFVAIYGADINASLIDSDQEVMNLNNLNTILEIPSNPDDINSSLEDNDQETEKLNQKFKGITHSYIYVGMWRSTFTMHSEDMDLYSINYLHCGSPKAWYAIPPDQYNKFLRLCEELFPGSYKACPEFLRHKMSLIRPEILQHRGITVNKIIHYANEFIITFPRGVHWGYNIGTNYAEASNFATKGWIQYGKTATICRCTKYSVRFSMDTIVQKFQTTDEIEEWMKSPTRQAYKKAEKKYKNKKKWISFEKRDIEVNTRYLMQTKWKNIDHKMQEKLEKCFEKSEMAWMCNNCRKFLHSEKEFTAHEKVIH